MTSTEKWRVIGNVSLVPGTKRWEWGLWNECRRSILELGMQPVDVEEVELTSISEGVAQTFGDACTALIQAGEREGFTLEPDCEAGRAIVRVQFVQVGERAEGFA